MSVKKITFGTLSMSAISMSRIAAQFFVMPILARLLSPHEYGVVSLAMPVVVFLMVFADAGVGQSLIKEDEDRRIVWSSSFWMTAIIGLVLTVICVAASPVVAIGFGEAQLGPVTRALAVIASCKRSALFLECCCRSVAASHHHSRD